MHAELIPTGWLNNIQGMEWYWGACIASQSTWFTLLKYTTNTSGNDNRPLWHHGKNDIILNLCTGNDCRVMNDIIIYKDYMHVEPTPAGGLSNMQGIK